jgi:signal peptidase I
VAERPPPSSSTATPEPAPRPRARLREFPIIIVAALVLAIVVKTFFVQAFFIPSASMTPTLEPGDRILVCRICLHVQDIHRGDVLVFSDPTPAPSNGRGLVGGFTHWLGEAIGVAHPADPDFVKRVGALPGETWEIRAGELFVDGQPIDRPFLSLDVDSRSFGPQTVPDGMLLMLGDDPLESGDSRFPPAEGGLGYVPVDRVIGKAFLIVWPASRIGRIR